MFSEKAKVCFCVREKNDQEEELVKVKKNHRLLLFFKENEVQKSVITYKK